MSKGSITLALLKPDIVACPRYVQECTKQIQRSGFRVLKQEEITWSHKKAEEFYIEHQDRFFFRRLTGFMASGPFIGMILGKSDSTSAIIDWRKLIGPSKTYRTRYTDPESIRGRFSITDTRNSVHGADSIKSLQREIPHVFPTLTYESVLEEFDQAIRHQEISMKQIVE